MSQGPDFLCIGMPKCGTSTLHVLLRDHSDIWVPPIKEIKYFVGDEIGHHGGMRAFLFSDHWAARQERRAFFRILRGIPRNPRSAADAIWSARFVFGRRTDEWYRGLFPGAGISGDISPAYHMLDEDRISEIARAFPDMKILILLRSPVEQLWSHCRMSARGHRIDDEVSFFTDQLEYQLGLCESYAGLVEAWSRQFPGKLRVAYLDRLETDPHATLRQIAGFLSGDPENVSVTPPIPENTRIFASRSRSIPPALIPALASAAKRRLAGFDAIDQSRAARWLDQVAELEGSGV